MAEATFHFPRGFLWGTATSSHQVEGNNDNNTWWAWEHEPGRILNGDKSGSATEWWNGRWRDDFDLAANNNQNAHRLSIEWSRVQPTPDTWDEDAIDHYRQMVSGLLQRGILPMVTLHHFTDPRWLAEMGGWESDRVVPLFSAYVTKIVQALKDLVPMWCTINEPNVYALSGYLMGIFPPGKSDLKLMMQVLVNMIKAHAAAYQAIHRIQPEARVGSAMYFRPMKPAKAWSPLDQLLVTQQSLLFNEFFPRAIAEGILHYPFKKYRIPEAKNTMDYFGLNYYTEDIVAFDIKEFKNAFGKRYFRQGAELSDSGWIANEPGGMFTSLKWARQFKLPIIITENGIEDSRDHLRPRYLVGHIHKVWRAANFNWGLKGYFHWTLVDNFEWERGWSQRFGLWNLDLSSQKRIKRPSVELFSAICRQNALSSEIVAQYSPELLEELFPG